mmetsp:Transcript_33181/g.56378  ORF Transcript_33181/g.56378 Transcript_33181/m.56378 type:complete len:1100 (+) Transcript_33181:411-3710(+)
MSDSPMEATAPALATLGKTTKVIADGQTSNNVNISNRSIGHIGTSPSSLLRNGNNIIQNDEGSIRSNDIFRSCEGGGGTTPFIVHTKHTCDACFQHPILGRRYTSTKRSNFDLCAACFDAYEGPEIGLEEAVLIRDKKHSRDFVLKLKIIVKGKGGRGGRDDVEKDVQVRRIHVSELWNASTSKLSYAQMVAIASHHANKQRQRDERHDQQRRREAPPSSSPSATAAKDGVPTKKNDPSSAERVRTTYIDDDGDKITISSDGELEDSFVHQVLGKFPANARPFRIAVTFMEDAEEEEPGKKKKKEEVVASNAAGVLTKRIPLKKREPNARAASTTSKCFSKSPPAKSPSTTTPPPKRNEFFIHYRHTCDGCSKSPIIGTRYHATKIPDFDLCRGCFDKYEGAELDFRPEVHAGDRRMQKRWMKKHLRDLSGTMGDVACLWDRANGDVCDFVKKVQEGGGVIESAAVYRTDGNGGGGGSMLDGKRDGAVGLASDTLEGGAAAEPNVAKDPKEAVQEPSSGEMKASPTTAPAVENAVDEKAPESSPAASESKSFSSDADGNGSIAKAIGTTLDGFVQAIEETMAEDDIHEMELGSFQDCLLTPSKENTAVDETNIGYASVGKEVAPNENAAAKSPTADLPSELCLSNVQDDLSTMSSMDKEDTNTPPLSNATPKPESNNQPGAPLRVAPFIHARHTCDNCSGSPIVGTRYHATNIPDFDLCGACYERYEGDGEKDFRPEVHARDLRKQQKWLKHHPLAESSASALPLDKPEETPRTAEETQSNEVSISTEALQEKSADVTANNATNAKAEEGSPGKSVDESFLSDADGSGSIAEAIGRTLDGCVQAIEEALAEEIRAVKGEVASNGSTERIGEITLTSSNGKEEAADEEAADEEVAVADIAADAAAAATDAFSIDSSMVSSMSDILKKMDDKKTESGLMDSGASHDDAAAASTGVPSVVTGATILRSVDGVAEGKDGSLDGMSRVDGEAEDAASDGDSDWSVISDDKVLVKNDDDGTGGGEEMMEFVDTTTKKFAEDKVAPFSPFVLAKWDTELVQLHELGFLDDVKNIDVLERLEAAHVGVDSTEKVTVQNAVEHLLGDQ